MEHKPPPNIPEDYKVWAKISEGRHEFSVPCKVFLPKTNLKKPQIYIFPKSEQFRFLPLLKKSKIFATSGNPPVIEIVGEEAHISGGSMRHWEKGLEEGYLKIYPTRLIIKNFQLKSDEAALWFHLTPSVHLSPYDIREYHYDGTATIHHGERFHFELTEDFGFTFFNHYKWQNAAEGKKITFSELVAESMSTLEIQGQDFEKLLSMFDDFLLLVSLVEGQRCVITHVNIMGTEEMVDIYRLNRSTPHVSGKHSISDCLIDSKDFNNFLVKAWKIYKNSPQHDLIKTALEIITNDVATTMENRFLALFSSIETLILAFRIENDKEFIVPGLHEWKKIKNELNKFIKNHYFFKNDKDARALMYQNICGLNRIPLQHVFKQLLREKNIELNDLWPFSSHKNEYPLINIRNRLVHGYGITSNYYADSFYIAFENLEYYAKRLLLATLGWDYNKSKLFRRDENFVKAWKDAME
ncbi:MAG: hypothetical protein U9N53_12260, partial [Bacteroidota bacterium]|nr:hypothetical protein [Bacteroidota bacterium]